MSDFNEISEILNHENFKVVDLGEKFNSYKTLYEQNRLSKDEFEELLYDLTDLEEIKIQAESMEERILLEKTARFLFNIASSFF